MPSRTRFLVLAGGAAHLALAAPAGAQGAPLAAQSIPLPVPRLDGSLAVEAALAQRRSIRRFDPQALALAELGQLLWAAQGVTEPIEQAPPGFAQEWKGGLRTAPSAGALYPLELYAAVGAVEGLEPGLYRYLPVDHALQPVEGLEGDPRGEISEAALRQSWIRAAPAVLVITGVVERSAVKYGPRAERYVHIEAGAAAQNVYLECESLGLGTAYVGAFDDEAVARVLRLPPEERPVGVLPVGHPASD